MARRIRSKHPRYRLATPSGVEFSLVDRGSRGWWVDWKPAGVDRIREHIGRCDRGEAQVRSIARVELLHGRVHRPEAPTLARAAAEMVREKIRVGRAANYVSAMESHLRVHILPALGADRSIQDVAQVHELLAFKKYLGEIEIELATANRILTTLRQLLKFAEDPGGWLVSPSLPKGFPVAAWQALECWHLLSPDEVGFVIASMPVELQPLVTYLANTGLRIGSALATQTRWIDWAGRVVHYPRGVMKARRPHTTELNRAAERALRDGLEASDDPNRPFDFSYWKAWDLWSERCGRDGWPWPDLRMHDLRHSFVSNQLDGGTPIHVVRDLAGHSSLVTTQLYAHSSDEARRAAVDRLEIRVTSPSKGPVSGRHVTGRVTQAPDRARRSHRRKTKAPEKPGLSGMGHEGLEPSANGLRVHCSTN